MTRLTPLLALAILLASAATSPTMAQVPSSLSVDPPAVAQIPSAEIPPPQVSPMSEVPLPIPAPTEPQQLLQATSVIVFEENRGQWDPTALFRVHAQGYDAFITRTGMALVQVQASAVKQDPLGLGLPPPEAVQAWATHVTLAGSNPAPGVTTSQPTGYYTNYFIGNDPTQWHTEVPTYTRVTLHDLYPGIDLDYYGTTDGQLKYDFIVHPDADPNSIRFRFEGAAPILDENGTLRLITGLGVIQKGLPITRQADGHSIPNEYSITGDEVSFAIAAYDVNQALIIDPLVYSTFLGSSSQTEASSGIFVDGAGSTYVTGNTRSSGYPVTPGAYDPSYSGGNDAFVTKLAAGGSSLVYSTFLGGSGDDDSKGLFVDGAGSAYVTGNTRSSGYPVTVGAYDAFYAAGEAFVTKLSASGSSLLYSTFLGGTSEEWAYDVFADAAGNAYITGVTGSFNYPVTPGAYDTTFNGGKDGFVTKLSASGSSLLYSTFIGGSSAFDEDRFEDSFVDAAGNVYVTGFTGSSDYPVTAGAYDTTYNGGWDAFVTKLSSSGSSLLYSTLFGGIGNDRATGVFVDDAGNAYITGQAGTGYPVTPGAYDTTLDGGAFVTKLAASGSSLAYSTFIGSSGVPMGVFVDDVGNAHIAGSLNSPGHPVTEGAYDTTYNGLYDGFVTKLSATGSSLLYSTFLGSARDDSIRDLSLDETGIVYLTGYTTSAGFPVTVGAYDTTHVQNGHADVFVTKLGLYSAVGATTIASPPQCDPDGNPLLESTCNSTRFGYTNEPWKTNGGTVPNFLINWGDFNGHEHILFGNGVPRFWMDFDLSASTMEQGFPNYYGQQVPVAQLERWTGSAWAPVDDGTLYGTLLAPAGADPWRLDLPDAHALDQLTSAALDTSAGSATFRLNPFDQPGLPGQKWILELTAAQSQLVAPPVIYVHGWNPFPYESASTYASERAGWATSMTNRVTEQSLSEFGQNPWAWSENRGLVDFVFDGKGEFRLASERLYRRILEVQTDGPENPLGADLSYVGPVSLIAHSLGGLVSRYMLEDTLPILRSLNGGHFEDDPDMQSLHDAWNQDNGPVPATTDLVGSVVMMGTPNLGSGWAEKYIGGVDKLKQAICPSSDKCRYYVTQDGQNLLTHYGFVAGLLKGGHEWDAKAWDKESIGAHRNENHYDSDVSVLADFELLLLGNRDNPVLENLQRTFAPPGVHYFLMAGVETLVPFEGDVIVSTKSATNDFDDRACWNRYHKMEANYGLPSSQPFFGINGLTYVSHGDLPFDRKLQDDALLFLSGDHESPCDNQPSYESSMAQQSSSMVAPASEEAETFGPAGFGMMSLEGDLEPSGYEAPLVSNYSIDGATYATRLEWDAPGLTNGTLILYGLNGTLANATFTVRSPSGETASMAAGNTSAVLWGDLHLGSFDRLSVDFPDAQQGAWMAWINRTTPWPGALIPAAWFNTSFAMELETDLHGVVGQAVTYRVLLPIPDAEVALELAEPSGDIEALTLLDDGLGPDESAGDGIYSGSHIFLENGTSPYAVQATVEGLVLKATGSLRIYDEEPAPMMFPPGTPLNVSATWGPGGGELTLTWQPPASTGLSVTGYDVYRGESSGDETFLVAIGNVSTYTDSGLGPGTTWHYLIASRNAVGYSRLSNEANATTFDVPSAPLNLTAVPGRPGDINLAWEAPSNDGGLPVTNYAIYAGDAPGSEVLLAMVGNVLTFTESGLDDGVTRYYKVAAVTLAGQGAFSGPASATTVTVNPTPVDLDGDGYLNDVELQSSSNPAQSRSTPESDDDGDGVINRLEFKTQGRTGIYCSGAAGVVYNAGCGNGYANPQGWVFSSTTGGTSVHVEGGRTWVWDGVCLAAASGDYQSCKDTSSYALDQSLYTGDFLQDGYGWRRVAAPDANDFDGDSWPAASEKRYGSNPMQAASGIYTDDDGDGIPNHSEQRLNGEVLAHCTGAFGLVGAAGCGNGYQNPPGYLYTTATMSGLHSNGGQAWVWDGICRPAADGEYETCKDTSSHTLSTTPYSGDWTSDGYGWRRMA